jgi:hypothetical protein
MIERIGADSLRGRSGREEDILQDGVSLFVFVSARYVLGLRVVNGKKKAQ